MPPLKMNLSWANCRPHSKRNCLRHAAAAIPPLLAGAGNDDVGLGGRSVVGETHPVGVSVPGGGQRTQSPVGGGINSIRSKTINASRDAGAGACGKSCAVRAGFGSIAC